MLLLLPQLTGGKVVIGKCVLVIGGSRRRRFVVVVVLVVVVVVKVVVVVMVLGSGGGPKECCGGKQWRPSGQFSASFDRRLMLGVLSSRPPGPAAASSRRPGRAPPHQASL